MRRLLALGAACGLAVSAAQASVAYVNITAPDGGDGASWATAFNSLTDALDVARDGLADEIWVAEGVYAPAERAGETKSAFELVDGVAMYGGFAGSETAVDERDRPDRGRTMLTADVNGDDRAGEYSDNAYHVLLLEQGVANTILDGFAIKGGYAPREEGVRFSNLGGGLLCYCSDMTIRNCRFVQNYARNSGGAIHAVGCSLVIEHCLFTDNRVDDGVGGAIRAEGCDLQATRCTFGGNSASERGGAVDIGNGGAVISNCILWDDDAPLGHELAVSRRCTSKDVVVVVDGCNVQGGQADVCLVGDVQLVWTNNIDGDPRFAAPEAGDYRLLPGSSCDDGVGGESLLLEGDMNCDGVVNAFDIDAFVLAASNPAAYEQQHRACFRILGDCNRDGDVDAFDIDGFVGVLVGR